MQSDHLKHNMFNSESRTITSSTHSKIYSSLHSKENLVVKWNMKTYDQLKSISNSS